MSEPTHGGKRQGAGRPHAPYKTTTIRVPVACKKMILEIVERFKGKYK